MNLNPIFNLEIANWKFTFGNIKKINSYSSVFLKCLATALSL